MTNWRTRFLRLVSAAFVLLAALPAPVAAWLVKLPEEKSNPLWSIGYSVEHDRDGNLFVGGGIGPEPQPGWPFYSYFTVVKFSADQGRELWRYVRTPKGQYDDAYRLLYDSAGHLLVGGTYRYNAFIAALDPNTGVSLWERSLYGTFTGGEVTDIKEHPAGGVIVAARVASELHVLKLDPATGTETWDHVIPDAVTGSDLAIDGDGNIIVGGQFGGYPRRDWLVSKLLGTDGAELWRYVASSVGSREDVPLTIGVDASGDAYVGGAFAGSRVDDRHFAFVKLAGDTGSEVWRAVMATEYDPTWSYLDAAYRVVVSKDGDPIVLGTINDGLFPDNQSGLDVVRIASATGSVMWRTRLDGSSGFGDSTNYSMIGGPEDTVYIGGASSGFAAARLRVVDGSEMWRTGGGAETGWRGTKAVALTANGRLSTAGVMPRLRAGFALAAGSTSAQLLGAKLSLKDSAVDPSRRALRVRALDPLTRLPSYDSVADPTLLGGSLEIFNPTTGESSVLELPAAKWRRENLRQKSFSYVDRERSSGPCRKISVRASAGLRITCSGEAIGFTLDEASQGVVGIRLSLGSLATCMEFGGEVLRDVSTAGAKTATFEACYAPRPATCP